MNSRGLKSGLKSGLLSNGLLSNGLPSNGLLNIALGPKVGDAKVQAIEAKAISKYKMINFIFMIL